MCCLSSFNIQNVMYVNQPDINLIIQKYKELILKKYCNYEINDGIMSDEGDDDSSELSWNISETPATFDKSSGPAENCCIQPFLKSTIFNM